MKIVKKNQLKIVIFTVKNCCMLHGRVFVMLYCLIVVSVSALSSFFVLADNIKFSVGI